MSALDRYREALKSVSARTGAPLSSLLLSFGILHEITALVPLVGIFYGARTLGVGDRVVAAIPSDSDYWMVQRCSHWMDDGQEWAARVGRRYGVFGFEKAGREQESEMKGSGTIAGDVANAVVAYAATKALLPVRVAASLYLAPAFSRTFLNPVRTVLIRVLKKRK